MDRETIIKKNVSGKTLDVGCSGRGDELHNLINDKNMYGLDIEIIKPKPGKIKGDAQQMPFKSNIFDTVIAGELIEHLPKPVEFIKEVSRVLKSNGRIIISTPNKNSLINKFFKSYYTKSHLHLFDYQSIRLITDKYFTINNYLCLPYTEGYLLGPIGKFFIWLRKIIHFFLPKSLQENMIVLAQKK